MKIDRLTPDPAILEELGKRLVTIRQQRRLSQQAFAEAAGIGIATLRRIEAGKDGRLGSWLRILKALEMEAGIDALLPEDFRSPMAAAKAGRQRGGGGGKTPAGDFVWGDERP
ncbi:MAG: helix-turn-helix transcriptional regulator [Planctomycetes bacterium]|nr:helix-turn-helix transcriptional regulator [Planctomycetota bacterium]